MDGMDTRVQFPQNMRKYTVCKGLLAGSLSYSRIFPTFLVMKILIPYAWGEILEICIADKTLGKSQNRSLPCPSPRPGRCSALLEWGLTVTSPSPAPCDPSGSLLHAHPAQLQP